MLLLLLLLLLLLMFLNFMLIFLYLFLIITCIVQEKFVSKCSVDKRGRPKHLAAKENYERFYDLDSSEEESDEEEDDLWVVSVPPTRDGTLSIFCATGSFSTGSSATGAAARASYRSHPDACFGLPSRRCVGDHVLSVDKSIFVNYMSINSLKL